MKAIDLKNKAMDELKELINLAIDETERQGCLFSEYYNIKQPKTSDQMENTLYEFLLYNDKKGNMDNIWELQYDNFKMSMPLSQVVFMIRRIKNGFGNGKSEQPTKNKQSELNVRSKKLQQQIEDWRKIYNRKLIDAEMVKDIPYYTTKIITEYNDNVIWEKQKVMNVWDNSAKNDIIRLCWKYITNPNEIEGINTPYMEEPKATFTPYCECIDLPKFVNYAKAS
jgi:hypothetical protein